MITEYGQVIKSIDLDFYVTSRPSFEPLKFEGPADTRRPVALPLGDDHPLGTAIPEEWNGLDSFHGLGNDLAIAFVTAGTGSGGWRQYKKGRTLNGSNRR
ncbi:hypothetical protein ACPA5B_12015 [Pseudomonas solani]|uniref:hypothetical protein n=1 Tax=Pseudomonas solani TaxID=2731552 RepID=UPI003C2EDA4B